jgi:predicted amidophosphoribosyltransferase
MKCPRCQQDNATAQKFCWECGTPLKRPPRDHRRTAAFGRVRFDMSAARFDADADAGFHGSLDGEAA